MLNFLCGYNPGLIDQYLMSPQHSNKALVEDGRFTMNKNR